VGCVIDTQSLGPVEIRAVTRSVLDQSSYREAARQLQREIAALPDIGATATIVERAATKA